MTEIRRSRTTVMVRWAGSEHEVELYPLGPRDMLRGQLGSILILKVDAGQWYVEVKPPPSLSPIVIMKASASTLEAALGELLAKLVETQGWIHTVIGGNDAGT